MASIHSQKAFQKQTLPLSPSKGTWWETAIHTNQKPTPPPSQAWMEEGEKANILYLQAGY